MPSIFSRFKGKDGSAKVKSKKFGATHEFPEHLTAKPTWDDAYTRKTVDPEEIQALVKLCTEELKARALDIPFLLLPFRPTSDPSAVRTFIRHFFDPQAGLSGEALARELRMTEPMVLSGVIKWCWSRLAGGVVGWDAYELFKIGEHDSNGARNSFQTFIPISVDNAARTNIIFNFFDLMSAIAAHGKANGFGGRKLSRMASWWAFEIQDISNGFEGGYKEWLRAADATSHLFFAYLRSLSPEQSLGGFAILPMSLQKLLQETEYPPQRPSLLQSSTNKVVMIVESVSPTPFSLLRRGSHFEYRDEDRALREFSDYDDPVQALTDECRRVLKAISAANQTQAVSSSKHSTSLRDASWSRFEDIGFGSVLEEDDDDDEAAQLAAAKRNRGLRTTPASGGGGMARPTTPSWADFLSSGFVDDGLPGPTNMLLPPDKVLPPIDINVRQRSSQSHRPRLETERELEPGELASISRFDLDDAFWWVWISSLAPEETPEHKSAFGRCAVIETRIRTGRWLVMEEIVKGAASAPDPGAYIAEKKGFFSWTRRGKGISRSKSTSKQALDRGQNASSLGLAPGASMGASKTSIAPDQQAKIQAAAQRLQAQQKMQERERQVEVAAVARRGRLESEAAEKTTSVFTLQPVIASEASPALKWASKYDKEAIREAYLSSTAAGRGQSSVPAATVYSNGVQSESTIGINKVPQPEITTKPVPSIVQQPTGSVASASTPVATSQPIAPKAAEAVQSPLLSPPPPPKDTPKSSEPSAPVVTPSPEGKKSGKKLHKEVKDVKEAKEAEEEQEKPVPGTPTSGPLRKLFNRKNRQSKLPENAASDVNNLLSTKPAALSSIPVAVAEPATPATLKVAPAASSAAPAPVIAAEAPAPSPVAKRAIAPTVAPVAAPVSRPAVAPAIAPAVPAVVQTVSEPLAEPPKTPMAGPVYAASDNSLSRVGTAEAQDAAKEFSRFDQGPLTDQPAFIPNDSDDDDDATPPPIARKRSSLSPLPVASPLSPDTPQTTGVPALDRWAQIRKNAAERAAKRIEEPPRPTYKKATDGDDDTSGEETIESRVARIKARVAELTGNMEGVTGPGNRPLPVRRQV